MSRTGPTPTGIAFALGSRVRLSPYFTATQAAGLRSVTVYNHMVMPVSYGNPQEEYRRLMETAAVWDVAGQRQIRVGGTDAAALTSLLVTRDIAAMAVGQAKYAPMCDHAGRLLNDPLLLRRAGDEFWLSIADNDVIGWIRGVAAVERLDVDVDELDVAPLAVQGPLAEEVVVRLLGEAVRDIRFFHFVPADLGGIPLLVGRAGWSKQGGFELYLLDPARGEELWSAVMSAGVFHDIGPGAPNTAERIEGGMFSLRTDAPLDADPFEVGLGRWVDLDGDASFIGKEALRARRNKVERMLVDVVVDPDEVLPVQQPVPVTHHGQPVGSLRVAVWSPGTSRRIGLAFVARSASAPGTELEADVGGTLARITVTGAPRQ